METAFTEAACFISPERTNALQVDDARIVPQLHFTLRRDKFGRYRLFMMFMTLEIKYPKKAHWIDGVDMGSGSGYKVGET